MTGIIDCIPRLEAAEAERRREAFEVELDPSGEVGLALARLAATMSVRVERCVEQENAALALRARKAEADFVPPEGITGDEAAALRAEFGRAALFDPSPEAAMARKYEADARRTFFRALKELRAVEKQAKVDDRVRLEAELASFEPEGMTDAEFDALYEAEERLASSGPGAMSEAEFDALCEEVGRDGAAGDLVVAGKVALKSSGRRPKLPLKAGRRR